MYCAIGVEPTKLTALTSGCSSSPSTATLSPCRTLKTPSGRPASAHSSASRTAADGSFSDGLRMNVLPQAIATGNIHIGTMAGKLNGVIPATTPSGSLKEKVSTSVETWSVSVDQLAELERPLGTPAQRRLRPLANASEAAALAASTSAADDRQTSACCCPVAGLKTATVRWLLPAVALPAIQCPTVFRVKSSVFSDGEDWYAVGPQGALTTRTGRLACRITVWATLPSSAFPTGERCLAPITRRSAGRWATKSSRAPATSSPAEARWSSHATDGSLPITFSISSETPSR